MSVSDFASVPAVGRRRFWWAAVILALAGPWPPARGTVRLVANELTLEPNYAAVEPLSPEQRASRVALAEEVANPISTLANLPLRFTYQDGIGPKHAYTVGLLAQPLLPFSLGPDWNLIVHTSIPLTYAASVAGPVDSTFGLGDVVQSFYLAPVEPTRRGWLYGFGPAFQYPTATDDKLGLGKWGAGPTGALVKQYDGWTCGFVAHQIWSFGGDADRRNVATTLLHPLVTYTWPSATSVTLDADAAYNWATRQWTVPVQLSVGQVVVRGRNPVQIVLGGRYFAEKPPGGPDWGVRLSVIILFPH